MVVAATPNSTGSFLVPNSTVGGAHVGDLLLASSGYLVPNPQTLVGTVRVGDTYLAARLAPLDGQALSNFFHDWIMGLTGLGSDLVRPRWQPEPPNIPEDGVTWLSFGITKRERDTFAAEVHYPEGIGYNEIRRHEVLHFLLSCYGPLADAVVSQFLDGMQVSQNREILSLNNMGLVSSGEPLAVPELFKDKWLYRVDVPFSIRRQIARDYPVENVLTPAISIVTN